MEKIFENIKEVYFGKKVKMRLTVLYKSIFLFKIQGFNKMSKAKAYFKKSKLTEKESDMKIYSRTTAMRAKAVLYHKATFYFACMNKIKKNVFKLRK